MQILHSKIYGQEKNGTPLLVFHGLFGMLDNWGSFGKEFGELFPTHLIDLRNHGKSFHSASFGRRYSELYEFSRHRKSQSSRAFSRWKSRDDFRDFLS